MEEKSQDEIVRLDATVYGRVQGVSFRYYTQKEAQRLGLTGWVANQFNGTVRTVAEGPRSDLLQFVQFLHKGSPHARVDRVSLSWEAATGEFSRFRVRLL